MSGLDFDAVFQGSVIDEEMLRRCIAKVRTQFPQYESQPHMLEITALAFACERLLDERAASQHTEATQQETA